MPAHIMAVMASSDWSVIAPRFVGEIALMTVAAVLLGYAVYRALPPSANPKLFGTVVPFFALGLLSYTGSYSAATALVLFLILAVIAIGLGIS
ncbi:MAG: hypothetical protein SH859_03985 [Hyphomicrobium aestuarii]|nr:hypothetical protein [Hyphomicrobium aestuarii]